MSENKIKEQIEITLNSIESPSIDSDIFDVFDTFSVLVYEKRGLNND